MASEDLELTADGGLKKRILTPGTGASPAPGKTVSVHYVGTLTDGTEFDSSRRKGKVFKFDLGKGRVIKGWDIGVASMKKGEKAVLTCRHDYAYGERGYPGVIPPAATLIFEVELLDF